MIRPKYPKNCCVVNLIKYCILEEKFAFFRRRLEMLFLALTIDCSLAASTQENTDFMHIKPPQPTSTILTRQIVRLWSQ
jgi:hypothetical protein